MAGYDDIDISAGVDAVLAEAARQGIQQSVLWLDYPTSVPYHQPLSSADVAPIYQRHNAVLAAKAAANPMLAIAPWAEYSVGHPEWFQPDGIHLRFPPGTDALARFIVAQLEALHAAALHQHPRRRPCRRARRRPTVKAPRRSWPRRRRPTGSSTPAPTTATRSPRPSAPAGRSACRSTPTGPRRRS